MITWTDDLSIEVAEAIREGNMRIEERKAEVEAAAAELQAEERAKLLAEWTPLIEAIKNSIPPWAHQFLTHPMVDPSYYNDHSWLRRAATIAIPDTATIFAYGEKTSTPVRFRPARYAVADDDETWDVIMLGGAPLSHWERDDLTNDFHMALAAAAAEHNRQPELLAEAGRRNVERQAKANVKIALPTGFERDWLGLARLAVGKVQADGNEAAIAYALIGILEQLQMVTTPLYSGSQHAIQTFDNSRGQL